jgi:hypothetical protein
MAQPKADPARCDVPGCGNIANQCTDGKEKDIQNLDRKVVPFINTCNHHENWPFSDDANMFASTEKYRNRTKAQGV